MEYKNSTFSYPKLNVLFTISSALLMIGIFIFFSLYAHLLIRQLRSNAELSVYLHKNLTEKRLYDLQAQLSYKEFVMRRPDGKPAIKFVSKEEAAEIVKSSTGENFIAFLGENPLYDSYVVRIKEEYYTPELLAQIAADVQRIEGVLEVQYPENHTEEIKANIRKAGVVLGSFALLLIAIVCILINNSIKLAVYSQRFVIRSMQLVGATPFFIKKPFLISATIQGIIGGAISVFILMLILLVAHQIITQLSALDVTFYAVLIACFLVFLGGIICFLSAYASVSRYIKMRLDDLHKR